VVNPAPGSAGGNEAEASTEKARESATQP